MARSRFEPARPAARPRPPLARHPVLWHNRRRACNLMPFQPLRRTLELYREAYTGLPRAVWLFSLAGLVTRAGTMVLPFLALYLREHMGLSAVEVGFLVGLYGVGAMAASVLGGWLSDRIDPSRVQQLALTAGGVGLFLLPHVRGFWPMAGAILVVATVAEAFRPALMVAIAQSSTPPVRARSFALLRLALNLGMAVGPAVGGFLAAVSYHWLFIADAVTCWSAAVLLAVVVGPVTRRTPPAPTAASASPTSALHDRDYLMLLGLIATLGIIFMQAWSTLPLALKQDFRLDESSIGLLLSLNAILIVLFEMVLIRLVEASDPYRVMTIGGLLVCAGMALLGFGSSVGLATLSIITWSFGEMLCLPMTNTIASSRGSAGSTGSYMGALSFAYSVSVVLAPVVGMTVYGLMGPQVLWLSIGILGPPIALSFAALGRRTRRTSSGAAPADPVAPIG